ncbi:MAG: type III pantothenate kinase [Firmicutes bacterium]|nr:type III pantothenate kinase [Bacillota bacterium]
MILTVDIGNTNVKFGVFDKQNNLVDSFRLSASAGMTSDEYGHNLKSILSYNNTSYDFEVAIISSVNPNLNYTIEHMVNYYCKVKPLIAGSGLKTGLNIKYDNPRELGSDRVMSCVGAYYNYGGPFILIDFGTATTFNAVDEKGNFLGGAISFGLKSTAEALSSAAAKLPNIDLVKPDKAIGRNTIAGMQSGIINGFIGSVEYLVAAIKNEMQKDVKVIATGGFSEVISNNSKVVDIVDRTLTLKGLNRVYQLNYKL